MRYSILALAATIVSATANQACLDTYNKCMSSDTSQVACNCDLASCMGQPPENIRQYCSTATVAAISTPYTPSTLSNPTNTPCTPVATASSTPWGPPWGQYWGGSPPVNAPAGSLTLGATCSNDTQCPSGVQCWSSQTALIRRCGNFNAACQSNEQCAYNTCNDGLCSGFLANGTMAPGATGTGGYSGGTSSSTGGVATYTGAATTPTMSIVMSGFAALFFGVVAWVL